jgi:Tol biopolymer transport system component
MAGAESRKDKGPVLPEGLLYRAFLSYRSTNRDLAEKLIRRLERWRTPRAIAGKPARHGPAPASLGRICRDREEFPTSAYVDSVIAEKLSQSQMLVVLCTPEAAEDTSWVGREIELFRKLRPDGEVHAIIGRGEPPACFPAALLTRDEAGRTHQPLAADMRRAGDGADKAVVKLIAGLLGVDFDTLWRRELRRRAARRRFIAAMLAVLLGSGAYLAAWLDARTWRNTLAGEAQSLLSEGRALDAMSMALASQTSGGDLVPAASDLAGAILSRAPGLALRADLGALEWTPDFSPDGRRLSALGTDDEAFILDLETGRRTQLGKLEIPADFTPDGSRVVARAAEDAHFVVDLATGVRTPLDRKLIASNTAFSADGTKMAGSTGEEFMVFNLLTGKSVSLGPSASDVSISADGRWAAMRTEAGEGVARNLATGADIALGPLAEFTGPAFSPDSAWIAGQSAIGGGFAIEVAGGRRIDLGPLAVQSVPIFSEDSQWIVSKARDGMTVARQLHADGQRAIGVLHEMTPPRLAGDFVVAMLAPDKAVDVVNLKTGARTHLGRMTYVPALSPDGLRVAWVTSEGEGRVADLASGLQTAIGSLTPEAATYFSADGSRLLMTDSGRKSFLFDVATGTARPLDYLSQRSVPEMSPDGRRTLIRGADESWAVLDLDSGEETWLGQLNDYQEPEFSPDGAALVAVGADDASYLMDLWHPVASARQAADLCSQVGDLVRPTAHDIRADQPPERANADTLRRRDTVLPVLRGRPWNPCDWRGLGAVLPDPVRGDGWFEGARQWWRLMSVRWLGGRDYACGETLSMASEDLRQARALGCAMTRTTPVGD